MGYWDDRYKRFSISDKVFFGSGMGSTGDAVTKRIAMLKKHCKDVTSILDVGCGDMNVGFEIRKLFPKAHYKGLDSSGYLVGALNRQYPDIDIERIFDSRFEYPSDLVINFDVLYHIMDDEDHARMLESLKKSWTKYLVIVTDGQLNPEPLNSDYIKRRVFDPTYFSDTYETEDDVENSFEKEVSTIKMFIFKK